MKCVWPHWNITYEVCVSSLKWIGEVIWGISGTHWLPRSTLRPGNELNRAFLVENTYCHSSKSHTSLGGKKTCQLNNPAAGDMGDLAEKTELLMILFSLLPLLWMLLEMGQLLCHGVSSSNNLSLRAYFNSYSAFNCSRNKAKGLRRTLNLHQVLLKHGVNKFPNNHGGVSNLAHLRWGCWLWRRLSCALMIYLKGMAYSDL